MHTKTRTRALSALALTLALGAGLTACGDDAASSGNSGSATEVSTTEHNDADVTFASDMITHHAQALSMVDLTLDRTLDPEVQALAEDIRAAQGPEIETMADWLTKWGEEVPETMRDHANAGHDMDDMSDNMDDMGHDDMPGMMSADDMDALENASDAAFQDMWLEMMIEHHEGAVEMAETETEDGQFKDAVDLAGQIIDAQKQEIDTMQGLLDS
ncbi:hypothetical protein ASC64_17580 [Nocardioides sp. Root122]|uniref:DUF305 domain-containing protein n=1 Tax=Nocardioides TaxID=1839 RepID=UPI000702F111|nr:MULTISPECIES: DUF305 domain-containing protein [Nocardioides]KQV63397.1 hypothetical protein ASC64_17580 [Nocardioides sp. Root122]MCK9826061.1 DUF305 domain-containing protein [Nocardioides cavernae]